MARIYVSGPYTAPTEAAVLANVNAAIDAGLRLFAAGHVPFIPHLTHYAGERAKALGITMVYSDYIAWDLAWLEKCQWVLCLGRSPGVNVELALAKKMQMPIFYDVESVPPPITQKSAIAAMPARP